MGWTIYLVKVLNWQYMELHHQTYLHYYIHQNRQIHYFHLDLLIVYFNQNTQYFSILVNY